MAGTSTKAGRGRRTRLQWVIAVMLVLIAGDHATTFADGAAIEARVGVHEYFSYFRGWPSDSYALDSTERFIPEGTSAREMCLGRENTEVYRGHLIRFTPAARVNPSFARRLQAFEGAVIRLSHQFYGRPPTHVTHRGTYNCRAARGRRARLSEHALGNALDLTGFRFARASRARNEETSGRWRRPFSVTVQQHWNTRRRRQRIHARFLHALAETFAADSRIFRGIVGPPRPRHHDHLHLDASPWRYAMFTYETHAEDE